MSNSRIDQHREKWSSLPLFTARQWVVTEDDIEAWNDLTYMRTLVDDLEGLLTDAIDAHDILAGGERDGRGLIEFDIDTYIAPWPQDQAAEQLAVWRNERDAVAA